MRSTVASQQEGCGFKSRMVQHVGASSRAFLCGVCIDEADVFESCVQIKEPKMSPVFLVLSSVYQIRVSVKVLGLIDEVRWEKNVFVVRGFGPDGPQPPARGKCFKQFVTGLRGVGHNLSCTPPDPGGIQVLERWQIAANHLL